VALNVGMVSFNAVFAFAMWLIIQPAPFQSRLR